MGWDRHTLCAGLRVLNVRALATRVTLAAGFNAPRPRAFRSGAINQANNAALTAAISELIDAHGVPNDRVYLNFFVSREGSTSTRRVA